MLEKVIITWRREQGQDPSPMTFSEFSLHRQGSLVPAKGTQKGYVRYWHSVVLAPFFFLTETDLHTRKHGVRLLTRRPTQTGSTGGPWSRFRGMEGTMGRLY